MFNSVVLDVFIGLIFIFLLYSLFATILAEIIATFVQLRARNLRVAVDRMLNDEKFNTWTYKEAEKKWSDSKKKRIERFLPRRLIKPLDKLVQLIINAWFCIVRFWKSFWILYIPKNNVIKAYYNHPEIKYLGGTGLLKTPSTFNSSSFASTVISMIVGEVNNEGEKPNLLDEEMRKTELSYKKIGSMRSWGDDQDNIPVGDDTFIYLKSLWSKSQGDLEKFNLLLEEWFDKTMKHTLEWYKRKIRLVTFILGFFIAWTFNVDAIVIAKDLSVDKDAREQMVNMATTYMQNNQETILSSESDSNKKEEDLNKKLDSLLAIKKQIQTDIDKANNILGLGSWPPDEVEVKLDPKTDKKVYDPNIEERALTSKQLEEENGKIQFSRCDKFVYFGNIFCNHWIGFFITAFAISLGAPFWFDLLNKIMKLRTSEQEKVKSQGASNNSSSGVSPLNRVG